MRSEWLPEQFFEHILAALMPTNRLAIEVSLCTGLRIDDVLSLRRVDILQERFTVKEMKTGKSKRIRLPKSLRDELLGQSGRFYVFENRIDPKKHRTRQAVYKDLQRAKNAFRCQNLVISPHTARKIYAVGQYQRTKDLKKVQALLNHSSEAVTMIYAMADELSCRQHQKLTH